MLVSTDTRSRNPDHLAQNLKGNHTMRKPSKHASRAAELGYYAARDDRRDGYLPSDEVSAEQLAHDAFSTAIEEDTLRGTDHEYRDFRDAYVAEARKDVE